MHRERYPTSVVASVPTDALVVASDGLTIYPAQIPVNSVVAVTVIVGSLEDKLSIYQSVGTIVAEHDIVPDEMEQGHIPQIDDVVGIAINLEAIVVQIVK